jgi:C1A family cysteine protease
VIENSILSDAGAEIRDGIKSVVDLGYCPETDWPYDINRFTEKPSTQAYADATRNLVQAYQRVSIDTTSIMQALASDHPVVVGFTVYDSFYKHADGTIDMPSLSDSVAGGHCVIVVGYDNATRRFKFQNSWGTKWGTRGFGTIPYDYLGSANYGGDYWVITGDQSAAPVPVPVPPPPQPQGCLPALRLILGVNTLRKAKAIAKAEIARQLK